VCVLVFLLQATGERNYHVFYQLLAGGEVYPEMKARLALKEADEYHYLNQVPLPSFPPSHLSAFLPYPFF
jgi:myosin heavy subunit